MLHTRGSYALTAGFMLSFVCAGFAKDLQSQPWDKSARAFQSQANGSAGKANVATVYGKLTQPIPGKGLEIQWFGRYLKASRKQKIRGWTITFYRDDNGQPGKALSSKHFTGDARERSVGLVKGIPAYEYTIEPGDPPDPEPRGLPPREPECTCDQQCLSNCPKWFSVVADLSDPAEWGWLTSATGDGVSYQDLRGTRSQLSSNPAFIVRVLGEP